MAHCGPVFLACRVRQACGVDYLAQPRRAAKLQVLRFLRLGQADADRHHVAAWRDGRLPPLSWAVAGALLTHIRLALLVGCAPMTAL